MVSEYTTKRKTRTSARSSRLWLYAAAAAVVAISLVGQVSAQQPPAGGGGILPNANQLNQLGPGRLDAQRAQAFPQNGNPGGAGGTFDETDPTQSSPDIRKLLNGDPQQPQQQAVRRDAPPPIEVVGRVIKADGTGKALLRVGGRYYLVGENTRFSLPTNLDPIVFTVTAVDATGVEIESEEEKKRQRLP